jgi:hypothetical protein
VAGPLRDPGPRAQRALGDLAGDATTGGGGGADTGAEPTVEPLPDAPVGAVDEWSLDQLHRRASEVGLEGRWEMTREQLVEALREP